MTADHPTRSGSTSPDSPDPTTEAGRDLRDSLYVYTASKAAQKAIVQRIVRIEAEARRSPDSVRTPDLDVGRQILDLFLPVLDEPHSYQDRQKRLDERLRKAHALDAILHPASPPQEGE
jgi:hypothetical protein